jgi:hypothetical protein
MVNKTQKRRDLHKKAKKKRNKKTIKRKRRGGKEKIDWKSGEWSKTPRIHAKFRTNNNNQTCGYSLYWNYYYLDEDDSIPLEKPPKKDIREEEEEEKEEEEEEEKEEEGKIKKREILQLLTNIDDETLEYQDCDLSEEKVLILLENNEKFQEKVKNGKEKIKEMIEIDKKQKDLINKILQNKNMKHE